MLSVSSGVTSLLFSYLCLIESLISLSRLNHSFLFESTTCVLFSIGLIIISLDSSDDGELFAGKNPLFSSLFIWHSIVPNV